jgi:hypothetical protein
MTLVELALQTSAQIRYLHWMSTKYVVHKALGDLYEKLDELLDRLIESYLSEPRVLGLTKVQMELTYVAPERSYVFILDTIAAKYKEMRSKTPESALQNIMDEILGAISQAKYILQLT